MHMLEGRTSRHFPVKRKKKLNDNQLFCILPQHYFRELKIYKLERKLIVHTQSPPRRPASHIQPQTTILPRTNTQQTYYIITRCFAPLQPLVHYITEQTYPTQNHYFTSRSYTATPHHSKAGFHFYSILHKYGKEVSGFLTQEDCVPHMPLYNTCYQPLHILLSPPIPSSLISSSSHSWQTLYIRANINNSKFPSQISGGS